MKRFKSFRLTISSILHYVILYIIILIPTGSESFSQIVFSSDTTLTGSHTFEQGVMVSDSTVTLRIEGATIFFEQGLSIARGELIVSGSTLNFLLGSGLVVSDNGKFVVSSPSTIKTGLDPAYVTLINSEAIISNVSFHNIKITVSGKAWWIPPNTPSYRFYKCDLWLTLDNPNPIFEGNRFNIDECYFWRLDTIGVSQGEYYNLSLGGNFGKIENTIISKGGIESPWASNSNLEIINNWIRDAKTGIHCMGVSKIEGNLIQNVETGIEGGTVYTRLKNISILYNEIIDVTGRAIDVEGDSITIHRNIIKGNGETSKGIELERSSGWITNNLISDFKISESSFDDNGIALFIESGTSAEFRTVVVNGNIIEYCGLSPTANPEIVSSIVHVQSPVYFTNNEMRLNNLGGKASNLYNFAGGPVLNIDIPGNLGSPVVVNYNFIHSNTFVATGAYEPTQTKGTLTAIDIQNRKLEFKGNMLYGDPGESLGIYLYPGGFPNGVVGDSLVFDQNTIVNNYVGVGTMAVPDLSYNNVFKDNTNYHIMRYGAQREQEMFAQLNNWDSNDPAVIDNKLFDNEENSNTGQINFANYYNVSYNVDPLNPGTQQLNQGDSLEITIKVTDLQGTPIENLPGFYSSSDGSVARIETENPFTDSDGNITGTLYAYNDGSTQIKVYAGGSESDPIQVNVGTTGVENDPTEISPVKFILYQNYPNPFNPTTKISWQSPISSSHSIKVYDVLGNEVATLINEYKEEGEYELEFNGKGLSSGIYFYQLKAGSFIQTRKMILMK